MLHTDPYPYLSHLLGAFFHQDAFDDGDSSDDILREFRRVAQPYELTGVRADIERFLHHQPQPGLLKRFEEIFSPDLTLAEDDEQLVAWLRRAVELLAE